ncbi:MAG: ATPase [Paludibacteraceae bacterium]|nr:ATPase [Paludibacteraceae bacterium]
MKTILTALFIGVLAITVSAQQAKTIASKAQSSAKTTVTQTLKVSGNCGTCKARIEKAASTAGATKADWNSSKQVLTVSFDSKKTSLDKIAKQIAAVGHDNEKYKATDKTYQALPGCCQYKRN